MAEQAELASEGSLAQLDCQWTGTLCLLPMLAGLSCK